MLPNLVNMLFVGLQLHASLCNLVNTLFVGLQYHANTFWIVGNVNEKINSRKCIIWVWFTNSLCCYEEKLTLDGAQRDSVFGLKYNSVSYEVIDGRIWMHHGYEWNDGGILSKVIETKGLVKVTEEYGSEPKVMVYWNL